MTFKVFKDEKFRMCIIPYEIPTNSKLLKARRPNSLVKMLREEPGALVYWQSGYYKRNGCCSLVTSTDEDGSVVCWLKLYEHSNLCAGGAPASSQYK